MKNIIVILYFSCAVSFSQTTPDVECYSQGFVDSLTSSYENDSFEYQTLYDSFLFYKTERNYLLQMVGDLQFTTKTDSARLQTTMPDWHLSFRNDYHLYNIELTKHEFDSLGHVSRDFVIKLFNSDTSINYIIMDTVGIVFDNYYRFE